MTASTLPSPDWPNHVKLTDAPFGQRRLSAKDASLEMMRPDRNGKFHIAGNIGGAEKISIGLNVRRVVQKDNRTPRQSICLHHTHLPAHRDSAIGKHNIGLAFLDLISRNGNAAFTMIPAVLS